MNKQPERTAKTKQALIDSFWELYKEKNIEKITIKEITANAGFYRSTFYEYFGSVYDVLEEIENMLTERILQKLPQVFSCKSFPEAFRHIISLYEENAAYMAVLFGPNGDQAFLAKMKELLKSIAANNTDLDTTDYQLELTIEMMSSAIIAMLNYWYANKDTLSINEILTVGSTFMQSGVLPFLRTKGFKLFEE